MGSGLLAPSSRIWSFSAERFGDMGIFDSLPLAAVDCRLLTRFYWWGWTIDEFASGSIVVSGGGYQGEYEFLQYDHTGRGVWVSADGVAIYYHHALRSGGLNEYLGGGLAWSNRVSP